MSEISKSDVRKLFWLKFAYKGLFVLSGIAALYSTEDVLEGRHAAAMSDQYYRSDDQAVEAGQYDAAYDYIDKGYDSAAESTDDYVLAGLKGLGSLASLGAGFLTRGAYKDEQRSAMNRARRASAISNAGHNWNVGSQPHYAVWNPATQAFEVPAAYYHSLAHQAVIDVPPPSAT